MSSDSRPLTCLVVGAFASKLAIQTCIQLSQSGVTIFGTFCPSQEPSNYVPSDEDSVALSRSSEIQNGVNRVLVNSNSYRDIYLAVTHVRRIAQYVDILLIVPSSQSYGIFEEMSNDIYDRAFETFHSYLYFIKCVLPIMRRQKSGKIALVSDWTCKTSFPGGASHSALMNALVSFCHSLRYEVLHFNIQVFTVVVGGMKVEEDRQPNYRIREYDAIRDWLATLKYTSGWWDASPRASKLCQIVTSKSSLGFWNYILPDWQYVLLYWMRSLFPDWLFEIVFSYLIQGRLAFLGFRDTDPDPPSSGTQHQQSHLHIRTNTNPKKNAGFSSGSQHNNSLIAGFKMDSDQHK